MPRWCARQSGLSVGRAGTAKRHGQAHDLIAGLPAKHAIADRAYDAANLMDTKRARSAEINAIIRSTCRHKSEDVSIIDKDSPSITRHVRRPVAKAPVSILIRFGRTSISLVGVCP
jgi:hypothetical protein